MDDGTGAADVHWLRQLPKVELHIHLEGAIPLDDLWRLVEKYGGDPATADREALARKFAYRDFEHFIGTWVWKNKFLRDYQDFEFIGEAVARDLASQNVRYAEVFFSPGDFARHGLETRRLAEAIRAGLERVSAMEVGLVCDLIRDLGPERAAATLECLVDVRDLGVIGVTIGGSEHRFPPELFETVFKRARDLGFRTSAHAGEAAGAQSVWAAIDVLRVDRIGHGTRAAEDPGLVEALAERQVPIELCPISNVRTGAIGSLSDHPARLYFERGIPVSVNTDDPHMFGNSLVAEYLGLMQHLAFSRAEVLRLIEQAIETSWLDAARKQILVQEFRHHPAWGT